jgi:hypothetical protein
MTKHLREQTKIFKRHGMVAHPRTTNGNHVCWRIEDKQGRRAVVFGASTPSCHRAAMNLVAIAKQTLRNSA